MNEQQSQQVLVTLAETNASGEPPKWGEMPSAERIAELEARIAEWEQLPSEQRGDPAEDKGGRSAFDYQGPHFLAGSLTGADLFYLAARALADSADPDEIAGAAQRLRTTDPSVRLRLDLSALHLDGATLYGAQLEDANLQGAHLEHAGLTYAHMDNANLSGAHIEHASLADAHLDGADLTYAHMDNANLSGARLDNASLASAHLECAELVRAHLDGADLTRAQMERADLRRASFDKTSRLNDAVLTGASFDQVGFDSTNLTVVDWSQVSILGDERTARERKSAIGKPKTHAQRLTDYKAAVRANRVLAVALRAQGLNEDADRFAYRAQFLQRRVLFRQRRYLSFVGSTLLYFLAGYGYRPARTLFWYLATIAAFAFMYMQATTGWIPFGLPAPSSFAPLTWYEALILSVSSFHGRGFFQPVQSLGDPVAALAAIEAVIGLFIEISFIATFTQRYFGAR